MVGGASGGLGAASVNGAEGRVVVEAEAGSGCGGHDPTISDPLVLLQEEIFFNQTKGSPFRFNFLAAFAMPFSSITKFINFDNRSVNLKRIQHAYYLVFCATLSYDALNITTLQSVGSRYRYTIFNHHRYLYLVG